MVEQAMISDMGAIFSETGAVETFQNDKEALAAAESGVAVKIFVQDFLISLKSRLYFPHYAFGLWENVDHPILPSSCVCLVLKIWPSRQWSIRSLSERLDF